MAWVSEQVVCGVLFEGQVVVFDDAAREVCAYEGEEEDGGEQGLWGSAAQFFDACLVQECADAEIAKKYGEVIINTPGLLQFANKVCILTF